MHTTNAKQSKDDIWSIHLQWWNDMFPHGCTRDTKSDNDRPS